MGIYFSASSFIILTVLLIIFSLKEKIKSYETALYRLILIVTIVGLFLEVATGIWYQLGVDYNDSLYKLASKLTSSYYTVWCFLFTSYLMSICNIDKKKWIGLAVISAICYIMIFILPIEYNVSNDGKTIFPGGPSLYLVYSMCGIGSLINLFICFFYQKKIPNKKFIPLYSLLLLGGLAFVIVIAFPDLFLIGFVFCLIDLIMFFTIENPDVKMLEQVEIARDAAERANRAKSDFLSNMSHEIRTPLNAIVGFSECILEEDDLDKAKGDAKDIVIASQNLLEIVNGILDISKIEANKMEIVETEYNLKENLNNLAKLMIPRIGEKPIELKVKMADDIPETLYGDGGKIRQIVSNILTNAVKYTEKGLITLDVNCVNKDGKCSLVISVEDTGRGIKPEKIDTIFQKFERLEEDRNTTLEGTGLGLAITKRLVEMLGGKIVVQSKYGTGSKFTVYLKQEIRNTVHKKEEDYNINQGNFDVKGKKILVVDDNKVNLKLANRLLQSFEVDVDLVESGMDCLSKINAGYKYDLILMDDMMPNMTGTETFKQLKELADFSTPVVVLTANAIEGMKDEYLNTGFNDYLAKPIDRLELERVLRTYLSSNVVQNQLVSKFEPLPDDIYNMDKPLNEKRDNS